MKYLVAACLLVATIPLQAAIPAEEAIELCRAEQNALRRLTCYDAISLTANSNTSSASANTANIAKSDKAEANSADFGIEHKKASDDVNNVLYMTVKDVRFSPRKDLIVQFENGQVWRQNDSGYYKINIGERHFIKRGALNSFFLGNDNNNRILRVRREK